jgi:hypothetical protein
MANHSRMEVARRRVRILRYGIGVSAAVAFVGGAALARVAHPGTHGRRVTNAGEASIPQASISAPSSAFDDSSGGSISPAPANSAPAVQSSGS